MSPGVEWWEEKKTIYPLVRMSQWSKFHAHSEDSPKLLDGAHLGMAQGHPKIK